MSKGVFKNPELRSQRISEALTGKNLSPAHRHKLSLAKKGKTSCVKGMTWKLSAEFALNMSKRMKGEGNHFYGMKHSPETLEKLRQASLGRKFGPRSPEVRQRISASHSGKPRPNAQGSKSPHWRGGATPENDRVRHSLEYKQWRTQVFQRDDYTCQACGCSGNMQADHELPFAYFPQLRFELLNGRTLCVECHGRLPRTQTQRRKLDHVAEVEYQLNQLYV